MNRQFAILTTVAVIIGSAWLGIRAASRPPYSGLLSAELVADSIWGKAELAIHVDSRGRGTAHTKRFSDEGRLTAEDEQSLTPQEVNALRSLLRNADLFTGAFWGTDLRGLDGSLVTLTVHDDSRVATIVCVKNESFEVGARKELLVWLTDRLQSGQKRSQPK